MTQETHNGSRKHEPIEKRLAREAAEAVTPYDAGYEAGADDYANEAYGNNEPIRDESRD